MATNLEIFDDIIKYQELLDKSIQKLEERIKPHIDFIVSIHYLSGDGYQVLSEEQGLNISVMSILTMIRDKEPITQEYFHLYGQ